MIGSNNCRCLWKQAVICLGGLLACSVLPAAETIELRKGLVVPSSGRFGRSLLTVDPLEQARVMGTLAQPSEGGLVAPTDNRRWQSLDSDEKGWLRDPRLRGGYVAWTVDLPKAGVWLLEARGHSAAIINGRLRAGDPYNTNWHQLPVSLQAGRNDLLFQVGRGRLKAQLGRPRATIMLGNRDTTLPHVVRGRREQLWCAIPLINASEKALQGLAIVSRIGNGPPLKTKLATQIPLTSRKVPFQVAARVIEDGEEVTVDVRLIREESKEEVERISLTLPVTDETKTHKRTFLSQVDGSVQYFAVNPATDRDAAAGLLLTLHGAGVPGLRQARVYKPKPNLHIVAPTNRRPFGFDWEDWGRVDALEVLAEARKQLRPNEDRIYLSGHSMGGHGTWHLGTTFPDHFAAIAPSAGWVSFWSYGGKRRTATENVATSLVARASNGSDTLALHTNLQSLGIYILHGDADNNVPVNQARTMRRHLGAFHPNFVYREQPGAGHWWGNKCCDWPPLIEYLLQHQRPKSENVQQITFKTFNPGVSHQHRWASIQQQIRPLKISAIDLKLSTTRRQLAGVTENVARLHLSLPHLAGESLQLDLDGQRDLTRTVPVSGAIQLARDGQSWKFAEAANPLEKGPHRAGPLKEAFQNRVLLVYGTKGTPEENRWALHKARYDAETFWYRGNGAMEVIADTAFDAARTAERSVVLYGNATTNAAWSRLLGRSPLVATRGKLTLGEKEIEGDDLCFFFVQPRVDSKQASIAAIGGTGITGMRASTRSRYFVSGIGYPDLLVMRANHFTKPQEAIVAAGFFDNQWKLGKDVFLKER